MLAKMPPSLLTMMLVSGWSVMSLNMFLPSLASMQAHFGLDYATVSLAISVYMYCTVGLVLVVGLLSDWIGRRPILLFAAGVYLVATLCTLLPVSFELFLVCRFFQGFAAIGTVLVPAVVRDTTASQDQVAGRLATVAMVMALGPLVAPMIGGFLDQVFGWQAIFVFLLGLGLIVSFACLTDFGETLKKPKLNWRQRLLDYKALCRDPLFWCLAVCQTFAIVMFFVFLAGMPTLGTVYYSMSSFELGVMLGILPVGYFAGNLVTSRTAQTKGVFWVLTLGRISGFFSMLIPALLLLTPISNPFVIFGAFVLIGFSNGTTIPAVAAAATSINPALAGSAAGLLAAFSTLVSAMFISITAWLLSPTPNPWVFLGLLSFAALISAIGYGLAWLKTLGNQRLAQSRDLP